MAGGLKRLAKRDNEVCQEALAYTLTKPLDLDTLTAELAEEMNHLPGIVVHGDPTQASEEHPVTLWATGIETNDLKKAVTHHGGQAPRTAERPNFLDKPEDEAFTDEEIQQAIRWLLKRGSA